MTQLKGRFIVENWDTDEIIKEFETSEEREIWLKENVIDGHMANGIRVSIYEFI